MDFALATSTLMDLNAARWIISNPDEFEESGQDLKKEFLEELKILTSEIEKTQKAISLKERGDRNKIYQLFKSYRTKVLKPKNGFPLITYVYCLKEYIDLKYGYLCDKSITELTNDELYFLDFFSAFLNKNLSEGDKIQIVCYCRWFVEGGQYAQKIRAEMFVNLDEIKEKLKLAKNF